MKYVTINHKESKLPNTLHELLYEALNDLTTCIAKGCNVEMGTWVSNSDSICEVCLAGAVMVNKYNYKMNRGECADISDDCVDLDKFVALDDLRRGYIFGAYSTLYGDKDYPEDMEVYWEVEDYSVNPEQFFKDMTALYEYLKGLGI